MLEKIQRSYIGLPFCQASFWWPKPVVLPHSSSGSFPVCALAMHLIISDVPVLRQRESPPIYWFSPPNASSSQDWTTLKPGIQNSIHIPMDMAETHHRWSSLDDKVESVRISLQPLPIPAFILPVTTEPKQWKPQVPRISYSWEWPYYLVLTGEMGFTEDSWGAEKVILIKRKGTWA